MSDWEGPMGDMDFEGLNDGVAHTIARLSKNLNPRNYDSSGMGPHGEVSRLIRLTPTKLM